MENQHQHIKGYRDLNENEIALINMIKGTAEDLEFILAKIENHLADQLADAKQAGEKEEMRFVVAEPHRWLSIARTHFQQGLMAATRAVAQPASF